MKRKTFSKEGWFYIFIGLLLGIFLLNSSSQGRLYSVFELDSFKIRNEGQFYRLISYSFCHDGNW